MSTDMEPFLRIGQLAAATGVDATVLRTWEARYGIPAPLRTEGGQRRYPASEIDRVRAMRALIEAGYRASEAARMTKAAPAATGDGLPPERSDLTALLVSGDTEALEVLDRLATAHPIERVVVDTLGPIMRTVGEKWATGEITVAQEHAATWLVTSWLGGQIQRMPPALHPGLLITAAPQGERHELGLAMLGVFLRRQGVPVLHLGSDLPAEEIAATARERSATAVCLSASTDAAGEGLRAAVEALGILQPPIPVGVGGAYRPLDPLPLPAFALPADMEEAARKLVTLATRTA